MTDPNNDPVVLHRRLINLLADDLKRASAEEIAVETVEDGGSIEANDVEVRAVFERAVEEYDRRRHAEDPGDAAVGVPAQLASLPVSEKRQIVERHLSGHSAPDGLTAAARKGGEMTEAELDSFLEDLLELGVIDENGKSA